jgi:hypothetical protein
VVDESSFDVAARIARALDAAAVPYAIGGAIALGAFSDPRATRDVDINLFVEPDALEQALQVVRAVGVVIDSDRAAAAQAAGDVLIGYVGQMRIDFFTPSIPFSWEAMRTRRRVLGPSGEAAYLSPEATAVFKLLFFRSKDLVDIERLVTVRRDSIDFAYIRNTVVGMVGETDERIIAWDRLCAPFVRG